ncbi:GNAT family N-acetyltransferase [Paludibacterium yongneupense]|uniref:GNAT family N-acetyltransferase n=1 Tax=Paludibacterium yongneupense TaxID=400061 RepID=UPI00040945CE|nr:GNAT family N-acetyltransferase [Paludibacterium yongneupense]
MHYRGDVAGPTSSTSPDIAQEGGHEGARSRTGALVVRELDLSDPAEQRLLVELTDLYARDAMGAGRGLEQEVKLKLGAAVARHPTTFAYVAEEDGIPLGHALCFLGFSSFYAQTTVNIHDLSVVAGARGKGIGHLLLQAVESAARKHDCAKLLLEVRDDNAIARHLYSSAGFHPYRCGHASYLAMEKRII